MPACSNVVLFVLFLDKYNSAESNISAGLVPSLLDDVSDLNPAYLLGVSMGKPVMGSNDNAPPRFQLLPCVEGFNNYLNKNINYQEKIFNENILTLEEEVLSMLYSISYNKYKHISFKTWYHDVPTVPNYFGTSTDSECFYKIFI